MGSQKKIGKVPDRCKLQSLHTVSKTIPLKKQAPRTSSGGEIYKLGHRIISFKNIGCKYIAGISNVAGLCSLLVVFFCYWSTGIVAGMEFLTFIADHGCVSSPPNMLTHMALD